jgi:hypothetical protein
LESPPPRPASSRASARRSRSAGPRRRLWPIAAVGVGIVGLLVGLYFLVSGKRSQELEVGELPSQPRGDPVPVAYGVRAGDVFETTIDGTGSMLLTVQDNAPGGGMTLDVGLSLRHEVVPADGGRTASTVALGVTRRITNVPPLRDMIADAFPLSGEPVVFRYDRAASGRPARSSLSARHLSEKRKLLVAVVLAGLSDVTTNFLPDRPVRLGESWDAAEVVELGPIAPVLRYVAAGGTAEEGLPPVVTKGRVRAEAREAKDEDETLRLRLAVSSRIEGDVVAPASPGWISGAMKVEGDLWVSLGTGLVVASDLQAELKSSYRHEGKRAAQERAVKQRIKSATKRVGP